ncbi:DUF1775 domain-containing protein [Microbacterium telephonicum]|uniref:Uncharacterized protein YcnI n=1 Tax=Microbacterium telephonicum TaxID=1714841 RepID=A0A498C2Z9_9MICO|nr:DUF1775 domain-containing protein [Microbacterium telephonicum]RLK47560.1 uncharacterized protein YcnI [Microbacterium telephonicum]
MTTRTPARRTRLAAAGVIAGAALVLAAPLAASAHVHVTPEDSGAGASTRLSFSFSHGCDDSPTTALVFDVPEGIDGVTPVLDGAWTISRELGDDGIPTQVTYTAVTPVETGIAAAVAMDVIFASSAAGTDVAFPVLQQCETGSTDWSEVAADGADAESLEAPAPIVAVGDVVETDGHGHAASDGHADEAASDDHTEAAATTTDPIGLWLGGGALVVAVAALVIALTARRRA